ncbi:cobalt ECF transporter T component CbiQ [Desulfotomaculum copahuensis]|uniref:Cobalt ECF transporter T component CbiQ n=1 Tax=Desulfotomaculum copahuensis TaxID=1838280 RepID=A0A1B7LBV2_9FIRM|nr:cobalt ECF transporter T component CbiQ [Desulfotomaculum copahuensis]OAT79954.1 cobalt ECF transporter T component CbiQ [Desulfotomaculum copahuensis]
MFAIDQYAYTSRLRPVHPGEKLAFALVTMVICLASVSPAAPLAVLLIMTGAVLFRAGIPWRFYLKLMTLPLSFLIIGVLTVAVSISTGPPPPLLSGRTLGGITIGFTAASLQLAVLLFVKSLGAVSCLYFLSLTTPMVEVISLLRRFKVPALFVELMSLIYRFIFVIMETAEKMYVAQSSRWGYASIKTAYISLGQLVANLFGKSYHRSQALFTALQSRCYNGDLRVLETPRAPSRSNIMLIAAVDLFLAVLALYTGGGLIARIHP